MSDLPNGCDKMKFGTRREAKEYIKKVNKISKHLKFTCAYYCEYHACFHITSMPKQRSRDLKRHLNKRKK
jgi:hypothetical protein